LADLQLRPLTCYTVPWLIQYTDAIQKHRNTKNMLEFKKTKQKHAKVQMNTNKRMNDTLN